MTKPRDDKTHGRELEASGVTDVSDVPRDAVILGDVDDLLDEPSLIPGLGMQNGRVESLLFYASGSTSRFLQPDAIPELAETDATMPNTPIENFILGCVDGVHTVEQIFRETGLRANEIVVALLTLVDKGLIRLRVPPQPEDLEASESSDSKPAGFVSSDFDSEERTVRTNVPGPGFQPLTQVPEDAFEKPESWAAEVSREIDAIAQETDISVRAVPSNDKRERPKGRKPASPPPVPPADPSETTDPAAPHALSSDYLVELKSESAPSPAQDVLRVREPPPLRIGREKPIQPIARMPLDNKSPPDRPPDRPSDRPPDRPLSARDASQGFRQVGPISDLQMRGRRLFDQAMKDRDGGDIGSAQMNVRLALSFDPGNVDYERVLAELSSHVKQSGGKTAPVKSRAHELYEEATGRENAGDVEGAIDLLEKAIKQSKEGVFYNRLGVILAMRKKDFARGREMIEKALEISPDNETYKRNLGKILARAATHDLDERRGPKKDDKHSAKDREGGRRSKAATKVDKRSLLDLFSKKK